MRCKKSSWFLYQDDHNLIYITGSLLVFPVLNWTYELSTVSSCCLYNAKCTSEDLKESEVDRKIGAEYEPFYAKNNCMPALVTKANIEATFKKQWKFYTFCLCLFHLILERFVQDGERALGTNLVFHRIFLTSSFIPKSDGQVTKGPEVTSKSALMLNNKISDMHDSFISVANIILAIS